jgi:hypothetical protein
MNVKLLHKSNIHQEHPHAHENGFSVHISLFSLPTNPLQQLLSSLYLIEQKQYILICLQATSVYMINLQGNSNKTAVMYLTIGNLINNNEITLYAYIYKIQR